MNKKGEGGGVYVGIVVAVVLVFLVFYTLKGEENKAAKELKCDHPTSLSCDDVQKCYDLCEDMKVMTWKLDCRDRLEPYLRRCYGGVDVKQGED